VKKGFLGIGLLGMSGILVACGGSSSGVSTKKPTKQASSPTTTMAPATVMTASTSLGTILVAANGRTLYELDADTPTMSMCTAACAMLWPPLTVAGSPVAGSGVNQAQLTVLNGPSGAQVVYAGHPLYEFSQDSAPGDVKGQNFANNIWHVLSGTGRVVTTAVPTPTTAPPTTSSSGSGSSGGMGY
jgi:predicted lipoprotein with Yx(FWY)xxD motif